MRDNERVYGGPVLIAHNAKKVGWEGEITDEKDEELMEIANELGGCDVVGQ